MPPIKKKLAKKELSRIRRMAALKGVAVRRANPLPPTKTVRAHAHVVDAFRDECVSGGLDPVVEATRRLSASKGGTHG
jgi:hypothetical protein